MSTESVAGGAPAHVDWRRAEFVLTGLAFLGFLALPIRLTTIYSGLPAHPLFVHVPVILIPTTIVAAIVMACKPQWLRQYGIALALVSIVAMSRCSSPCNREPPCAARWGYRGRQPN